MKYIKGFDTIRAYAVILVIISHWGPDFSSKSALGFLKEILIPNGIFGVFLFFVLSGFLITLILLHEKLKMNEGKSLNIVKNFYIRRFLRIFPIYYLVILLCYLLNMAYVKPYLGYFVCYASNYIPLKFMYNSPLAHTWSLSIEEQFYIIWPWIIIFIDLKYLKYILIGTILLGSLAYLKVIYGGGENVLSYFSAFGFGALYAYMRLDKDRCARFENAFKIIFPILLFIAWQMRAYAGLPVCVMFSSILNELIGLALIMFMLNNKYVWINKYIMENRVLNYLGKISYGLYLYHYAWGVYYDFYLKPQLMIHTNLPGFVTGFYFSYLIKSAGLLLISTLSYKYIEQPILRLKRKFEYAPETIHSSPLLQSHL